MAGGQEAEKGTLGSNLFCRPGLFKFFSSQKTLASKKTKAEAPLLKHIKRDLFQVVGERAPQEGGTQSQACEALPHPNCPPLLGLALTGRVTVSKSLKL